MTVGNQDELLSSATFKRLSSLVVVELEFDIGSTLRIHLRPPKSPRGQNEERGMIWIGCAEWVMISRARDMLDSDTVLLSGSRLPIAGEPNLKFHFGPLVEDQSFMFFCGEEFTLYVWSEKGKYDPTDVLIMFSHSYLPVITIHNDESISGSVEESEPPAGTVH